MSDQTFTLPELCHLLREEFGDQLPVGSVRARTAFRDALVARLGCSQLEGEQLVDTMILGGYLLADRDDGAGPAAEVTWQLHPEGAPRD